MFRYIWKNLRYLQIANNYRKVPKSIEKKFLRNLILIITLNLLIKPFWILGIDRAVQNVVGASEYGFYFAVFNFSFLLNVLLDLGITNFNNRNIAQNNHLLTKHLPSLVTLKLVLAILYIIISSLFGFIIGYTWEQYRILVLLLASQFFVSFILYLRSNISALHLFKVDSFISVLDRVLMILICSVLLWGNLPIKFTIEWYIYAQLLGYFITALITLAIVYKKAGANFFKLKWNYPFSLMIIKQSIPFAILILLMTFYNRIDSVMLERLLPNGDEQSGIYASAYRLLDASNMIAFLLAGLLLPIFSKLIKEKARVSKLLKLAFVLIFILSFTVSVSCSNFSFDIMSLLYHEHVIASSEVFRIIMFCFIPISITYIFGTLLTANGNLKELNIIAGSGMLVNITLNLIFIPLYQSKGAAIVSLTTQSLTALAQVIFCIKIFKLNINFKFLLSLLFYVFFVLTIIYTINTMPYLWIYKFAFITSASLIAAFVLRLFKIKSVLDIIKKEK
ncbi:MAG: hypothetical protein A2X12_00445 [Bacteroidetes bacterium GWE2_29_8]|nr:MAG: hypothetical protein A2X12_00445 [Bacteroidetes bacterium GWE2_29_8]